jgi:hypothetical protein
VAAEAATKAAAAAAVAKVTQFPYTAPSDPAWFAHEPPNELLAQCLRPGHCSIEKGDERDWLHTELMQLGHAFNERGEPLMALTWFECCFAVRRSTVELMSSSNMRLKLGQAGLVRELYKRILTMDLGAAERKVSADPLLLATPYLVGRSATCRRSTRTSRASPY